MIINNDRDLTVWELEKIWDIVHDFHVLHDEDFETHYYPSGRKYTDEDLDKFEDRIWTAIDRTAEDMKKTANSLLDPGGYYEVTFHDEDGKQSTFICKSDEDLRSLPNVVK